MQDLKNAPIGIFDSGIGGLTVAKAVIQALPNENILYFGDTARVPYGIKSEETVRTYALQITRFLLKRGVKLILIACNTVSASAKKEIIQAAGDVPVLDVITAGAEHAVSQPNQRSVGVIGTLATVNSQAYVDAIRSLNDSITVSQQACPLLVPLAEEGWLDNDIALQTLRHYLGGFEGAGIQSLILGCTHYPLFKQSIAQVLDDKSIQIIDSADSITETAKAKLKKLQLLNTAGGSFHCCVSDRPQRFHELAERFLGRALSSIEVIELD